MGSEIISVIIPVYNVSAYIQKCIDSVINQSFDGLIELIIIDDCGCDDSMDKVKEYLSKQYENRKIKILENEYNKGQSVARNYGLRNAIGEFIFFLDSDDYIEKDAIRILYEKLVITNADLVSGETNTIKNGKICNRTNLYSMNNIPLRGDNIINGIFRKWHPVCWNKLIRKDFLLKNKLFFPEDLYYEDLFWAFEVAMSGSYFETIKEVTYNYIVQENSTTRKLNDRHYNSLIKLIGLFYYKITECKLLSTNNRTIIIAIYDEVRSLSIDIIYNNFSVKKQKEFLKIIQKQNIVSIWSMVINKKMSLKMKIKSLPFYMGRLGYNFIKIKSKIH